MGWRKGEIQNILYEEISHLLTQFLNSLFQGACCRGAHYALAIFGAALVLTVCVLISIETYNAFFSKDDNSTNPNIVTQSPNTNGFG